MKKQIFKVGLLLGITGIFSAFLSQPASQPIGIHGSSYAAAGTYLERQCLRLDETTRQEITSALVEAEYRYGVEIELLLAVMLRESNCVVGARSPKGAIGLMQVLPQTALFVGYRNPMKIRENILAGARYLSLMMNRFGGDRRLALAAYNAGPEKVKKHRGIPPYRETRNYVEAVLRSYTALQQEFQAVGA